MSGFHRFDNKPPTKYGNDERVTAEQDLRDHDREFRERQIEHAGHPVELSWNVTREEYEEYMAQQQELADAEQRHYNDHRIEQMKRIGLSDAAIMNAYL